MRDPHSVWLAFAAVLSIGTASAMAQGPRFREPDRFAVSAAEDAFILVEQTTGRTWLLAHSEAEHSGAVWLPIERIESPEEAAQWRRLNKAIVEKRQQEQERQHDQGNRRGLLEELARRYDELRKRFGPDHPEVRELAEHRERIARELDDSEAPDRGRDERDRDERPNRDWEQRREIQEQRNDDIRRRFEQRRREIQEKQSASVKEILLDAERRLQEQVQQMRRSGAGDEAIERLERLKGAILERLEDVQREFQDTEDREADAADNRLRRQSEEREVIERRRQLQQRQRDREKTRSEREERSADSDGLKQLYEKTQAAIRGLQQRIQNVEEQIANEGDTEPAETNSGGLPKLLMEEEVLTQRYGPDHPAVRAIRKQVEVTQKLLGQATSKHLLPLLVKKELLLEIRGPKHPEVMAVTKQIEVTRRLLEKEAASRESAEVR